MLRVWDRVPSWKRSRSEGAGEGGRGEETLAKEREKGREGERNRSEKMSVLIGIMNESGLEGEKQRSQSHPTPASIGRATG